MKDVVMENVKNINGAAVGCKTANVNGYQGNINLTNACAKVAAHKRHAIGYEEQQQGQAAEGEYEADQQGQAGAYEDEQGQAEEAGAYDENRRERASAYAVRAQASQGF